MEDEFGGLHIGVVDYFQSHCASFSSTFSFFHAIFISSGYSREGNQKRRR